MEQRELLKVRQYLDHRHLEEGFLLFAVLQVIVRYQIKFHNGNNDIPLERNKLVEMVVGEYKKVFYEKWTGRLNVMYGAVNAWL